MIVDGEGANEQTTEETTQQPTHSGKYIFYNVLF